MQTGTNSNLDPQPAAKSIRREHKDPGVIERGEKKNKKITHLRGRAGVEGVLWRAQRRSFSLESAAAVLGLAQLPAKHNRGLLTARAKGGQLAPSSSGAQNSAWRCQKGALGVRLLVS